MSSNNPETTHEERVVDDKSSANAKTGDNVSVKSETSSSSRPLKIGVSEGSAAEDKTVPNALEDDVIVKEGTIRSTDIASPTRANAQPEEVTPCCHHFATNLYSKALESAKKALPKSKPQRSLNAFPRNFGEDFDSIGPEGFHYLDDAATECSSDYQEDFKRDSMVKPELIAKTDGVPIVIPVEEPSKDVKNLQDLQEKYGLPEDPKRVEKYDPRTAITPEFIVPVKFIRDFKRPEKKEKPEKPKRGPDKSVFDAKRFAEPCIVEEESEVSFIDEKSADKEQPKTSDNRLSDDISFSVENVTNLIEEVIEEKSDSEESPKTSVTIDDRNENIDVIEDTSGDRLSPFMLIAHRASQIILEDAIEEAVKVNTMERAVESKKKPKDDKSVDKNLKKQQKIFEKEKQKELGKQQKELTKQQKEIEKKQKAAEKASKDLERRESKQLSTKFREEDKKKQKIQKKQKEFEKLKKEKVKEKQKDLLKQQKQEDSKKETQPNVLDDTSAKPAIIPSVKIEVEDEYEDIDKNIENQAKQQSVLETDLDVSYDIDDSTHYDLYQNEQTVAKQQAVEYKVEIPSFKIEYVPDFNTPIPESGDGADVSDVSFVPSTEVVEVVVDEVVVDNEEESKVKTDVVVVDKPVKVEESGKPSIFSAIRLPNMDAIKSKVLDIFPKKSSEKKPEKDVPSSVVESENLDQNETNQKKDEQIKIESEIITTELTVSQRILDHEYENIALNDDENDVENEVEKTAEEVIVFEEKVDNAVRRKSEKSEAEEKSLTEGMVSANEYFTEEEEKSLKANRKKKSKTRSKLNRLKAKAIESLPKISNIKSSFRTLLPKRSVDTGKQKEAVDYQRFVGEHEPYSSRRFPPDSDTEFFSDSELCSSLQRPSNRHVYEEMAATQERFESYMTPITGPLRPPRRQHYALQSGSRISSVPALSTQLILKNNRIPPPRPPPPKIFPVVQIIIDTNESKPPSETGTLQRKTKQRVPPNIYYNNIRLNYKPKRRFIHTKTARIQQNIYEKKCAVVYAKPNAKPRPPRPPPVILGYHQKKEFANNEKNLENKYDIPVIIKPVEIMRVENAPKIISDDNQGRRGSYPIYESLEYIKPRAPPRKRRKAARSHTMDAIYWKPFTWKTRRCRSLTELDVRRKINRSRPKSNYENVAQMLRPDRLSPPSGSPFLFTKNKFPDISHLYASVKKLGSPTLTREEVLKRPLPPPPVPPRPKCLSLTSSASSSIAVSLAASPYATSPTKRDVCVSTKDNGLIQCSEKETQIDNGFVGSIDENGNLGPESPKTPVAAVPLTPTTPTPTNSRSVTPKALYFPIINDTDDVAENGDYSESTTIVSDFSSTTDWFSAQPNVVHEWDQDTICDVSSIASNYQSPDSTLASRYQSVESSLDKGRRYNSDRRPHERKSPVPPRRSLPEKQYSADNDDSEDTDELLGLTKDLQSELKQILDRRTKVPNRPESVTSSNASLQDTIDSSSDGDDISISSVNEQSPEFFKRKQQQKLHFIAKELCSSEEIFVDVLHLLNCDFRAAVANTIPDDVLNAILKLLPQLQQINEQLLSELKIRIDNWSNNQRISDVLVKICPFLKQYSLYIRDFESMSANYEDALRRYPLFAAAVKDFESTSRCQKLAVKHYMLKPVQRMPQYRLLLQDYLRHLNVDSPDYADTVHAFEIVSQVAEHANNTMKLGDNFAKLLSIQNSIIGGHEIIKPGRMFIKEGELMKLSRKGMQPRWFILFSDCLMYLTPLQNGVYRVNHELSLTGMRVSLPSQEDFQNEFSVISLTRSFSLASRSTNERQEWVTELNKAIQENAKKRISFVKSNGQDFPLTPLQLGICAPVWIPDARVTMCQLCTSEFTVTFRRHHCRCCGKVVCGACSANKAPLPYLKNRSVRVCDECYEKLFKQLEQLEKYAADCGASSGELEKTSESDEAINSWKQHFVRSHPRTSKGKGKKRYVPSVLKEVCANDQGSLISGYLYRRESKAKWKRYWFVIKDMVLYTYKASEDVAALKSLPLLGFKIEKVKDSEEGIDSRLLMQLSHPGQPSITFRAETVGSAERWLKAMKEATTLE